MSSDAVINLAVVACGDRANETLNLLKSALMFTKSPLNFYVITEPELKKQFKSQVFLTYKSKADDPSLTFIFHSIV